MFEFRLTQDEDAFDDDQDLQDLTHDESFCFVDEESQGFSINGITAGFVFAVYKEKSLIGVMNWKNIPDSTDVDEVVMIEVNAKLEYLKQSLQGYDLTQLNVIVFGGQESSLNTLQVLREVAPDSIPTLDLHFTFRVLGEDYFDLLINKYHQTFVGLHHPYVSPDQEFADEELPPASPTFLRQHQLHSDSTALMSSPDLYSLNSDPGASGISGDSSDLVFSSDSEDENIPSAQGLRR